MGVIYASAKSGIAGHFSIPGGDEQPAIKSRVEFLLKNGNFKYGGLDLEVSCFEFIC